MKAPVVPRDTTAVDEIRSAATRQHGPIADLVQTLDGFALRIGTFRVSVWDLLVIVAILVFCFLVAKVGSRWARGAVRRTNRLDSTQELLAEKLLTIVIWLGAGLLAVDLLGIDLTALAVFSGAFGLAIGFGLQKTVGNLIAGIILLMDKSIKPGDVIAIPDQSGQATFGQIRKIGVRAVSIVTREQKEYLIPNENLMVNQVENWSYSSRNVRISVDVGVSYTADLDLAETLMMEAAKSVPRVLVSPVPVVWMSGFGDNAVQFSIKCWIEDPEEGIGNVQSAVLKEVWARFKAAGIELPFPQRDLHLRGSAQLDRLLALLEKREGSESADRPPPAA